MANDVTRKKIDIAEGGIAEFINIQAISLGISGSFDFPSIPIDTTGLRDNEIAAVFEKLGGAGTLSLSALWIDPITTVPICVEPINNGDMIRPKGQLLQFRVATDAATITDGAAAIRVS